MLGKIKPEDLLINPFTLIGKEWILISAGTEQEYDIVTASQGALGVFWGKNMTSVYICPQRYTLEFMNEQEYYALNFSKDSYKKALAYYGTHLGRDVDKAKESGLTPAFDAKTPYFQEAELVLICRKLRCQKLGPAGFIGPTLDDQWCSEKDCRHIFQGKIVEILQKE